MKTSVTLTLDHAILTKLRSKALEDRRSLSQTLSLLIENELLATPTRRKAAKRKEVV